MNPPKIVYILCVGHSGSTMLDLMLGLHKDLFSTGELQYLPNQYHRNLYVSTERKHGLECSCGRSFLDCKIWSKVRESICQQTDAKICKYPLKFKIDFLKKHSRQNLMIYHKILRRVFSFAVQNNLHFIMNLFEAAHKRSLKHNKLLYQTIENLTKAKYIIDSSKDLFRLWLLTKAELDIRVIVLKRDIYGVASSMKKLGMDPIKMADNWLRFYNQSRIFLKNISAESKIFHLDYEEMVSDPLNTMNRVFAFLDIDQIAKLPAKIFPSNYHLVGGNGIRYSESLEIRKDMNKRLLLNDSETEAIASLLASE
jgi:hypothetical protein